MHNTKVHPNQIDTMGWHPLFCWESHLNLLPPLSFALADAGYACFFAWGLLSSQRCWQDFAWKWMFINRRQLIPQSFTKCKQTIYLSVRRQRHCWWQQKSWRATRQKNVCYEGTSPKSRSKDTDADVCSSHQEALHTCSEYVMEALFQRL